MINRMIPISILLINPLSIRDLILCFKVSIRLLYIALRDADVLAERLDLNLQVFHHEVLDVVVHGMLDDILRRVELYRDGGIHDEDLIRHGEGFLLVVGDIDHRGIEFFLNVLQLFAKGETGGDVKRGHRLVKKDDVGIQRQGASDGDTLLLSAREGARLLILMLREPHLLDEPERRIAGDGFGLLLDLERILDVLQDRHILKECVILKNEPHLPLGRGRIRDIDSVFDNLAVGRGDEPDQHAQEGGLAAAGGSQDG